MANYSMKLIACFMLVIAFTCGTLGQRTQTHVGVLKGDSVTLYCRSNCERATWRLNSDIIVQSGQLLENDTNRFNFSCNCCNCRTTVCKLTILEAEIEDSGEYFCYDSYYSRYSSRLHYSRVTMILAEPQGEVNEKYMAAGDNITINCSVDYHGPETPYIEWTDENGEVVPGAIEWMETDKETNPDAVTFVTVSELDVIVPDDVDYLPPYTCTVRFYSSYQRGYYRRSYLDPVYNFYRSYYSYENLYTPYTWTSHGIKVSYCPRNMWVSEICEDFTTNSTLSCGSDAYPTAKYEWNAIRGSGFVNGDVFVVSSSGFFNISCTAYNFLRHPDDECIGETLYTAGYLPFQCDVTPIIVLGVLFALSLILNILIVVLVIICARRHDVSLVQMFGVTAADDKSHKRNDYTDRPDPVPMELPNRQPSDLIYEATDVGDEVIYEETDIDGANYEHLGQREPNTGSQRFYQRLAKSIGRRTSKSPGNIDRRAARR